MIILTGGAGFIGSCFLQKLNSKGINNILVVDNLAQTDKWKNLIGKKYLGYEHKSDFIERLEFGELNGQVEAIFHIGACSTTTETDIDYLYDNNVNYSRVLAEFAIVENIPFHYASSAATYGLGENGYSDSSFENLKPLNGYGWSKHSFDEWVLANDYQDRFTGYKYFNVFGPNEYHKGSMSSMIFKAFEQVSESEKIRLFKSNHPDYIDGGQMRDFVYVKDVVNIMWDFYQKKTTGIYNIGTGIARSWNDLAKAVFASMEKKENIEYFEMPDNLKDQYQNFTQSDNSKFNSVHDYNYMTLEESVEDYIKNHLSNNWKYL